VETVNRAVVVLGMEMVEGLVLTMSVFDSLSAEAPEIPGFGREAFWTHCSGCGALAKMLLEARSADRTLAAEGFVAGLLHDVGKLVEDRYLHDKFAVAVSLASEREGLLHEAEQEAVGATHVEIGNHLAEWWNLPSFVANAVRYHHTPHLCEGDADIVQAVHVADVLMDRLEIGASGNFQPPPVNSEIWSQYSITKEQLADMRQVAESGMG
jgi:HD-like signal output (HDOD) protein